MQEDDWVFLSSNSIGKYINLLQYNPRVPLKKLYIMTSCWQCQETERGKLTSLFSVLVSRKRHVWMVRRRQFDHRCSAPPINIRLLGKANGIRHVNCKCIRTHTRSGTSILFGPFPDKRFLVLVEKRLLELAPHLHWESIIWLIKLLGLGLDLYAIEWACIGFTCETKAYKGRVL